MDGGKVKKKVERIFCDIGNCKNDMSKAETKHKCDECKKDICYGGWGRWGERGVAMNHTVKVKVQLTDLHSFTIELCPDCCVKLFDKYGWPIPRREE